MEKSWDMNKQEIMKMLDDEVSELEGLLKRIEESPSMKAHGSLNLRSQKGRTRFFQRLDDGRTIYLGEDQSGTIKTLCAKLYCTKLRTVARRELEQLRRCLRTLSPKDGPDNADIELVHGNLPDEVRANVKSASITDDNYARKWERRTVNTKRPDKSNKYPTKRGEHVRSKSELIIANMLYDAGVPYRYEMTLVLDEALMIPHNPDFIVLNKRTRKEYIWEHQGMMDDPEYCNDKLSMMSRYMERGYFPGKNIIYTFETKGYPLRVEDVQALISQYLL